MDLYSDSDSVINLHGILKCRHADRLPARGGRHLLSDKHTVATDPHINPPYVPLYWENHWAENYTIPVNQATSVQVTDKFDSGFRIAVSFFLTPLFTPKLFE